MSPANCLLSEHSQPASLSLSLFFDVLYETFLESGKRPDLLVQV